MSFPILFIFTLDQFRHAEKANLLTDEQLVIATANVDVLAICANRSLPVEDLSEYLGRDGQCFQDDALQICERMAAVLEKEIPEEYRRLAFHVTFDLLYPITWFLQVGVMVENLIKQKHPGRAFCFGDIPHIVGWDPQPIPYDTGNMIARWTLEQNNIPLELLYLAKDSLVRQRELPTKKHALNNERLPWPEADTPVSALSMAAMTGAIGIAEQSSLLNSRDARPKKQFVAFPDGGLRFLPIKSEVRGLQLKSHIERAVDQLRSGEEIPDFLSHNNYLKGFWLAWSTLIQNGLSSFHQAQLIADIFRPRVVFTAYDVFGHTRCQTEGLLSAGITPISVHHSGFNGGTEVGARRHHRAVGHIAGWSDIERHYVSRYRNARFQYRAIGSLRPDIHQSFSTVCRTSRSERATGKPPVVLFLSSRIADYAPIQGGMGGHVATWRVLRNYCARRSDLKFILKKHPRYDYAEVYGETQDDVGCQGALTPADSLTAALRSADLVVTVNMVSTAMLDAVCAGKPVLFLDSFYFCSRSNWLQELGVEVVPDVPALERRIDELLNDRTQADALVEQMQANLKKFVVATGPEAAERLWGFVKELCPDVWDEPQAKQPPPNPVSLWCWDFARVADSVLRGESDPAAKHLAARFPGDLSAEGKCPVDLEQLAPKVFHQVLWKLQDQWGQPGAKIVRDINRLLPAKYRMRFKALRPYLVQALLLDAEDERRSPGCRIYSKLAVYTLAPGRLLALASD